ncbi:hypothetical protein [Sorangium sp. So ce131]|uniref:hypothetical protein n=1 Tax=Sorangium sp. So ce131 TaxID=3133282 RepID=UPI003F5E2939
MLTIVCVNCRRASSAKELDEESGFAVCRRCGAVFEVPTAHLREARDDLPGLRARGRISAPPSYSVSLTKATPKDYREHVKRELTMSWPADDIRLSRGLLLFLATASWSAVGIGLFAFFNPSGHNETFILIGTFFLAVLAIAFSYLLFLAFLCRAHLTIKDDTLFLHHTPPLPWSRDVSLRVDEIDQIFCSRWKSSRHGETSYFTLNARLRSGEVRPLLPRLKRAVTAMFLQQRVEDGLELSPDASASTARFLDEVERVESDRRRQRVRPRGPSE